MVLAVSALVVVGALRLMAGPVNLDFLKPRIVALIDAPGNDVHPQFDHISFEWSSLGRPMRLALTGLRFTNAAGQVLATAPMAALTFDPREIFRGKLLPTSITVERPVIEIEIAREGGIFKRVFASREGGAQGEAVSILIDQLLAEPNYDSLLGQLDSVLVEKATITMRDLKTDLSWTAPSARVHLKRDAAGVAIDASARFTGRLDSPVDVALSGIYARDRSRVSVEARVDGLKPMAFADLSPDVVLLRGVDITLSGRMRFEATGDGEIRSVAVDITGGDGSITLPGVLPAAHTVKAVSARFAIDTVSHSAAIDHIALDFGAARIHVAGSGTRTAERRTFAGRADIRQIPVDRLGDYWPLEFAAGGREWALGNLSKGMIDVGAEFALSAPVDDLSATTVDRLVGLIDYGGMTVRYMPNMPELQDVSGTARYENGTLRFENIGGGAVGLRVAGGAIELADLDKPPPQMASLRLPIAGSAQDVIRFLARPKLGLPKDVLYDYRRLGGTVTVDLDLRFPLINELTMAELEIKADAQLANFSVKDVLGHLDLAEADLRVKYSESELAVTGHGKLDGAILDIGWREMFGQKPPFRRRYEVKGTVPAGIVQKAGFPSVEPYVTGAVGLTLQYQVATNGTSEVAARFDLRGAKVTVDPVAFTKEAGVEGHAQTTMKLAAGGKLTTVDFEGRGGGLQTKGRVRLSGDSTVQQVNLQQVKLGRTDVSVDWRRNPGGVELAVKGPAFELARLSEMLKARDAEASREPKGAASVSRTSTRADIQVQNVIVKRGSLGYLNGKLELVGDRLASADLSIGAGKGSTFRVTPGSQGRTLFFYVADFGQALRDAGWLDGLVDGYLHIEGKFNDTRADSPLSGWLKMGPYRLQRVTPRQDIGTLNSAIDGLNSAGNALQQFDSLTADLVKTGDKVQVRNGRTSGQSIGLTTQGTIDLGRDTALLSGVVVPAFALNNLLSNVPLLGPLLTGGKDGGLFAISYQLHGPFDDLKTDVNMMSAVTPGALRDLFNTPAGGGAPAAAPPAGAQEMQRAP